MAQFKWLFIVYIDQSSCQKGSGSSSSSRDNAIIVAIVVTALVVTLIVTVAVIAIVLRLKRGTKQGISNPAYGKQLTKTAMYSYTIDVD